MGQWIAKILRRREKPPTFTLPAELAERLQRAAEETQASPQEMAEALIAEALEQRALQAYTWQRWLRLTRREKEVARLVYRQYDYREIAEKLHISPDTAKAHIHNVLIKYGLHSKRAFIERLGALEWLGLLTDND